jgi:hypothetical protein
MLRADSLRKGRFIMDRVNAQVAYERLSDFPHLKTLWTDEIHVQRWLQQELKKPEANWNLLAGWLTVNSDSWGWWKGWVKDLDLAIFYLRPKLSDNLFKKFRKKLVSPHDRSNSKGVLAEISIARFLAKADIPFDAELKVQGTQSNTNVDFTLYYENNQPVHVEVQYVQESAIPPGLARLVTPTKPISYCIDFDSEKQRVMGKVYGKIPKFTDTDITFVALALADPVMGSRFGPTEQLFNNIFNSPDKEAPFKDLGIRHLIDGVMWFEWKQGNGFFPINRGIILNPQSPFKGFDDIHTMSELWLTAEF